MKKFFLILPFVFTYSCNFYAQGLKYKGLNVFANAHHMNVILGSQSTVGQPIKTVVSVSGQPNFGLSVEALFSLKKNLNLHVGLGVHTINFKQKISGLTWGSDLDPNVGFRSSTTYYESKLAAIDVPTKLTYALNKSQSLEIGLTTSIRFNKKSDFYTIRDDDNLKTVVSENAEILVRNVNFILSAGYNFKVKLNDKTSILIQPYAAIHVLGDELMLFYVNNYFYQVGLNTGLGFSQKRKKSKATKKKIGGS